MQCSKKARDESVSQHLQVLKPNALLLCSVRVSLLACVQPVCAPPRCAVSERAWTVYLNTELTHTNAV